MARVRCCVAFGLLTTASMLPVWGQNYLTGTQTGAESRLDSTPRNVVFPLTVSGSGTYTLAGGIFYMKDGPNTTGNVTLTVYNSASPTTPLGSITLSNSQFCGPATGPACQSYFFHTFKFSAPVTLSAGSYTLVLSSEAFPQQNTAYFVKGVGTTFSVVPIADDAPPPPPNLSLSKSGSPENFTAGGQATYLIQVVNRGGTDTAGTITLTDTLHPSLTFVSATGPSWSCGAAGQVVTCTTSAAIAAGASLPVGITVNVAANAPSAITNVVTVTGGGDVDPTDNSSQLVTVVNAPNLSISKTAVPSHFTQGQNGVVYAILVSNNGNAPSSGTITVRDTLDPSLTFVSASGSNWSCGAAGQVVTCTTSAAIAAGASLPIAITVNVAANAPSSVSNAVTVAGGGDIDSTDNAFGLVTVVNAPQLTVSKTATPSAFSKGQSGVYTILVSNSGPAPSSGTTTVTDTLDPNLTFVSATGPGWSCGAAAQIVTCTTPVAIPSGASAPSITITVNVGANAPVSVINTVMVSGGGSASDSSQLVTAVDAIDLRISKTASASSPANPGGPAIFTYGQTGFYTILVSNGGSVPSSGIITVTDTLDPNLNFVSAAGSNWSCSAAAKVVTCTTSAVIPAQGSAPAITINVSVAANGEISITNVVTVTGGGDVDPTDNTFTLVSVVSAPKLSVSKTATPSAFSEGQSGVYTILVSNGGTAPSLGPITVTDTLDPNLTFVSATGSGWSCSAAAQVVTCTTPAAVPAGASAPSITITVNVPANTPVSVTNNVRVSGGASADDSSRLVTAVDATDLRISKTANPTTFIQGQNALYTITASNIGNAPTSGMITVRDTLDPNLTFVSATGSNWSCSAAAQVVTCTTSAVIAAQGSAPAIDISVNVAAKGQISVTNLVIITGGGDVDPIDNTFTLVSAVNAANLSVSKTATPAAFSKGQTGVYTILVRNGGAGPSSGTITVSDTLDPNLTFVSATGPGWSCSSAAPVVTCTTSAVIPAGTSAPSIAITVNVAPNAPSSVTNAVTVAGGGGVNSNNSFQLVSAVNAANLSVSKTATPSAFSKGQTGVYTILVSNGGTASSSGTITVTDTLDPNLTFVSATGSGWSCGAAANVVNCTTPAAIPAGASAPSITITVNVGANAPVSVTNSVVVAGGGSTSNSSQLVTAVDATDLRISKTANPATLIQGQNTVYTITVSNIGNAPASGTITVTDTLHPNLKFVSATGSNWSCSAAAQVVTCTTSAAIAAQGSAPAINITVSVAATGGTSITNVVTVAGGGDVDSTDNTYTLVSDVTAAVPPAVHGVPTMTTPMLMLTGMVLIGLVVWLRRGAAYPGQPE